MPKATVDGATVVSKIDLTDDGHRPHGQGQEHQRRRTRTSATSRCELRAPDGALVLLANSLAGANMTLHDVQRRGAQHLRRAAAVLRHVRPAGVARAALRRADRRRLAAARSPTQAGVGHGLAHRLDASRSRPSPARSSRRPRSARRRTRSRPGAHGDLRRERVRAAPAARRSRTTSGTSTATARSRPTAGRPTTTHSLPGQGHLRGRPCASPTIGGFSDQTTRGARGHRQAERGAMSRSRPTSPHLARERHARRLRLDATPTARSCATSGISTATARYEVDAGNIPTIQRLFGTSGTRTGRPAGDRRQRRGRRRDAVTVVVQNRAADRRTSRPAPAPAIVGAERRSRRRRAAYDLDGTIVDYEWDFDNDGIYEAARRLADGRPHLPGLRDLPRRPARHRQRRRQRRRRRPADVVATQAPVAVIGATPLDRRAPATPVTFDPAGSFDPDVLGSDRQLRLGLRRRRHDRPDDDHAARPVVHSYTGFGQFTARAHRHRRPRRDDGRDGRRSTSHNDPPVAALSISPDDRPHGRAGDAVGRRLARSRRRRSPSTSGTSTATAAWRRTPAPTPTIVAQLPEPHARHRASVRVTDNDGATATATGALAVDPADDAARRRRRLRPGGGGARRRRGRRLRRRRSRRLARRPAFTASLSGASIQALQARVQRGVGVRCQVDRSATCVARTRRQRHATRSRLRLAKGKRARKPVRIARGRATHRGIRLQGSSRSS